MILAVTPILISDTRYLLDTNVVSELRLKRANSRVHSFVASIDPSALFVSVMTLGEMRKGVENKDRNDPVAAAIIAAWADGVELTFADRILGVDIAIASLWGTFSAGRTRPVVDTLLAATAIVHGLTLVTRNTADVQDLPVKLLNPWQS